MKFKGIIEKEKGHYIHRYDVVYETNDHKEKVYEMISRNKKLESYEDLSNSKVDSVVIIVFNADKSKILIDLEYRMPTGRWVYNFPAGLIDQGESAIEAAKRELQEETGLTLIKIDDIIGESYSAVGFSNEKNICVVGIAEGDFKESSSSVEEIKAGWYSKEEVRELLKQYPFAARTQAFCYVWANMI